MTPSAAAHDLINHPFPFEDDLDLYPVVRWRAVELMSRMEDRTEAVLGGSVDLLNAQGWGSPASGEGVDGASGSDWTSGLDTGEQVASPPSPPAPTHTTTPTAGLGPVAAGVVNN